MDPTYEPVDGSWWLHVHFDDEPPDKVGLFVRNAKGESKQIALSADPRTHSVAGMTVAALKPVSYTPNQFSPGAPGPAPDAVRRLHAVWCSLRVPERDRPGLLRACAARCRDSRWPLPQAMIAGAEEAVALWLHHGTVADADMLSVWSATQASVHSMLRDLASTLQPDGPDGYVMLPSESQAAPTLYVNCDLCTTGRSTDLRVTRYTLHELARRAVRGGEETRLPYPAPAPAPPATGRQTLEDLWTGRLEDLTTLAGLRTLDERSAQAVLYVYLTLLQARGDRADGMAQQARLFAERWLPPLPRELVTRQILEYQKKVRNGSEPANRLWSDARLIAYLTITPEELGNLRHIHDRSQPPPKFVRRLQDRAQEAASMFQGGHTSGQVADRLGVSQRRAQQYRRLMMSEPDAEDPPD